MEIMEDPEDSSNGFFRKMVDELIAFAEYDKELAEGLKWLDGQAQNSGISIYDQIFKVLYKHDVNVKAMDWLKTRN